MGDDVVPIDVYRSNEAMLKVLEDEPSIVPSSLHTTILDRS